MHVLTYGCRRKGVSCLTHRWLKSQASSIRLENSCHRKHGATTWRTKDSKVQMLSLVMTVSSVPLVLCINHRQIDWCFWHLQHQQHKVMCTYDAPVSRFKEKHPENECHIFGILPDNGGSVYRGNITPFQKFSKYMSYGEKPPLIQI